jgi:type I restriction enzyme, S subunit
VSAASWVETTLGEVAEIVGGATPKTSVDEYWDGDVYWATPKDLSELEGAEIASTPRTLTKAGLRSCSARVLPPGSVLLSSRAPIGHVAINTVPMATNQGFKSLIPHRDRVDAKFLYWWLRRNRPALEAMGTGATFKEISKKTTEAVPLRLPPVEEQRRIAAVLDAADGLRAKRREALAKLDTLTQAIYIDLFDDPLANRLGWETSPLSSLGRIHTGKTPPGKKQGMYGDAVPFITPGDLESTEVAQRWLSSEGAAHSRVVPPGSTLVCCIGATIGKVGCASELSAFNQQINAIEWNQEAVEPAFGTQTMRFLSSEVARRGASTTLPLLKKSAFERLEIPVPPLRHQVRFTKALEALDGEWRTEARQADKLDELFASLQQRAFWGEL